MLTFWEKRGLKWTEKWSAWGREPRENRTRQVKRRENPRRRVSSAASYAVGKAREERAARSLRSEEHAWGRSFAGRYETGSVKCVVLHALPKYSFYSISIKIAVVFVPVWNPFLSEGIILVFLRGKGYFLITYYILSELSESSSAKERIKSLEWKNNFCLLFDLVSNTPFQGCLVQWAWTYLFWLECKAKPSNYRSNFFLASLFLVNKIFFLKFLKIKHLDGIYIF